MTAGTERAVRRRGTLRGAAAIVSAASLLAASCGGGGTKATETTGPTQAQRAAALSLQQAMNSASRAIDDARGTRDSLERLAASLQSPTSQTSDVIGLLTPQATGTPVNRTLLSAARQQRSFLQFAAESTTARTRRAANSAVVRARDAGRRASDTYARLARQSNTLAGLLPASTTFNTGRLRDAVRAVNHRKAASPTGSTPNSTTSEGSTACGDGLSVNSVTSCPFARNVKDAYEGGGGAAVIDVYSPVTKRTYTMDCTDGVPTICRGGNGAIVYIR